MQTIGQYQIIRSLQDSYDGGRKTYLASDSEGNRVIIKQFRFAVTDSNWSSYKSLEKEITNLKSLSHSNIPQYIESFESDTGACLVMEYLPGENLSNQRLSISEVAKVLHSILDILIYIQSRSPSVVHRDVKPQNIIRSETGKYCLVDFGLAINAASTLSFSSVVSGTPGFMPPELFRGKRLDRSADLYSLAVTVFCLLTGKSANQISNLIDTNFVLPLDCLEWQISEEFKHWLNCCLNPNPKKRFISAEEAKAKFELIERLEFVPKQKKLVDLALEREASRAFPTESWKRSSSNTFGVIETKRNFAFHHEPISLKKSSNSGSIVSKKRKSNIMCSILCVFVLISTPFLPVLIASYRVDKATKVFDSVNEIINQCSPNYRYCISVRTKGNYLYSRVDITTLIRDTQLNKIVHKETQPLVQYSFSDLNHSEDKLRFMRKYSDRYYKDTRLFLSNRGNMLEVSLDEKSVLKIYRFENNKRVDYDLKDILHKIGIDSNQYFNLVKQNNFFQPLPLPQDRHGELVELRILNKRVFININTGQITSKPIKNPSNLVFN